MLFKAASAGDLEALGQALAAGASVGAQNWRWQTALHRAAENAHVQVRTAPKGMLLRPARGWVGPTGNAQGTTCNELIVIFS